MAALKDLATNRAAPHHRGAAPDGRDRPLRQLIHDAENHLNAMKGLGLMLGNSSTHPKALIYRASLQNEAHQLANLLECIRADLAGQDENLLRSRVRGTS